MGTLTNSTHRQDAKSVRIPPSSNPIAPPAPTLRRRPPSPECGSRTLRESVADERQRRGRGDSAPYALHGAGRDQPGRSRGEAAEQRGQRKHDQAEHEHASSTEHVAETASEEQQPSERQGVRSDDPLEVCCRKVQGACWIDGNATVTMVASSTTISCAAEMTTSAAVSCRGWPTSVSEGPASPSWADAVGVDRGVRNARQDRAAPRAPRRVQPGPQGAAASEALAARVSVTVAAGTRAAVFRPAPPTFSVLIRIVLP